MKIRLHRKGWRQLWEKTNKYEVICCGKILYRSSLASCKRYVEKHKQEK